MARILSFVFAILLIVVPSSQSQSQDAVGLLKSSLAALGGGQRQLPVTYLALGLQTDLRSGTSDASSPIQIEALVPDKFLSVVRAPSGPVTTVVNGKFGQVRTSSGKESVSATQVSGTTTASVPIFVLSKLLSAPTMRAYLVGQETLNGQLVNHIAVRGLLGIPLNQQLAGDGYEVYTDPQSALPVRLRIYQAVKNTFVAPSLKGFVTIDITFSDYQPVSGFQFPLHLTWAADGRDLYSVQLSAIQVNAPVNASDFSLGE